MPAAFLREVSIHRTVLDTEKYGYANPAIANPREQSMIDWLNCRNPEAKISIGKNMRNIDATLTNLILFISSSFRKRA
jgi:hypothetical protein